MSNGKEVAKKVYEAAFSIRTMGENVKLDLRVPSKMAFLLVLAVEQGLSSGDTGNLLGKVVSAEDKGKLEELAMEILKKAELEEFYQKLKELSVG